MASITFPFPVQLKSKSHVFQCTHMYLADGREILDDDELFVEYSIQPAEPDSDVPFSIEIESACLIGKDNNITEHNMLPFMNPEQLDQINSELIEKLSECR